MFNRKLKERIAELEAELNKEKNNRRAERQINVTQVREKNVVIHSLEVKLAKKEEAFLKCKKEKKVAEIQLEQISEIQAKALAILQEDLRVGFEDIAKLTTSELEQIVGE